MTYTNWTMQKDNMNSEEYSQVAEWCNKNQTHTIEDMGEYYAVVKIPEPSEEEIKQARINELKQMLANADYWGQKYLDGEYTEEEWEEKKALRKSWREELRNLEDGEL